MSLRISRRLLTLVALSAAVVTIVVFASGSLRNTRGSLLESYALFTLFDTNNDSRLSETEMRKGFAKAMLEIPLQYVKYDVNHDGKTDFADEQDIIDSLRAALQSVCGNGTKESGEQCDNGTQNGVRCSVPNANLQCTYCSTLCVNTNYSPPPVCGNGFVESGEQCDDGNKVSQDNCSSTCAFETHLGCENKACTQVVGFGPNTCSSNAECLVVCGDGLKEGTEQCDDGNKIDNDTCNNSCQILQQSCTSTKPFCAQGGTPTCCGSNQWSCTLQNNCSCYCSGSTYVRGATSCPTYITNPCVPPASICGNGIREASEQCDDGNYVDSDDCTNLCKFPTLPACDPLIEYAMPLPNSRPGDLVTGPDKKIWFIEYGTKKIARITPLGTNADIREFSAPLITASSRLISGIDGNLWFTSPGKLNRISQTGAIKSFPITVTSDLYGIAAGSDGNLWITNGTQGGDAIIKMTPQGTYQGTPLTSGSMPVAITAGPENTLWFTEVKGNAIGRITTAGDKQEYLLQTPRTAADVSAQSDIVSGRDGNLWFVMQGKNSIGKITKAGIPTEYPLAADRYPTSITAVSDTTLWYTQAGAKKIGKITSLGVISDLALPPGVNPDGLNAGPNGYLWFTDSVRNKVGVFSASCNILPFCGNGAVDPNEDCDDGNSDNTDSCTNACRNPYCGDGFKQANEECDAGPNDVPWCTPTCKNPVCGDGYVNGTEQCDDGNRYNDDECSNQCTRAVCGDGVRQDNEQCDDGNYDTTDDCTICRQAYCGDGFVNRANEECDFGTSNGGRNIPCTTSCRSTIINF